MSWTHNRSSGGQSSSASRQTKGTPIAVPKHGSINEEDTGTLVRRNRKHMPSHPAVVRNTLDKPTGGNETGIAPNSFYEKAKSNLTSFSAGTPTTKTTTKPLSMRKSPVSPNTTSQSDPPKQNRNARQNTPKLKQTQGVGKGKKSETITISDSDSENEADKVQGQSCFPSRAEVSNSPATNRKENGYGNAQVNGYLRRKSDSPSDTRNTVNNTALFTVMHSHPLQDKTEKDASKGFGPSADKLDDLAQDRTFHICKGDDQPQRQGLLSHQMKDRFGKRTTDKNVNKNGTKNGNLIGTSQQSREEHFINKIQPSISKKPVKPSSKSEENTNVITENTSLRRTFKLEKIAFLGLGQVRNDNEDYWLEYGFAGTLTIKWLQGESHSCLRISKEEIERVVVCEELARPLIQIELNDPEEFKQNLLKSYDDIIVPHKNSKSDPFSIVLLLYTDFNLDIRYEDWANFIRALRNLMDKYECVTRNQSMTLESDAKNLPILKESSTKTDHRVESTDSSGPRAKANDGPIGTRSSLRLESLKSAPEDGEKAESAKLEKKDVASSKVPQTKKFQYPFEAKVGAVAVYPSDIEKLNDHEMLNDTIVEFGLKYLLEQIKERDPDLYSQIYVFSSFFYKRMSESKRDRRQNYTFVKKWTKKVDIFRKKYLVVPINENMHWYLAIITNPFFAVKEIEKKRGLYESEYEKDMVESNQQEVQKDESTMEADEKEKGEIEEKDEQGDVLMRDERRPSVEAVDASLTQESTLKEEIGNGTAEDTSLPFQMATTPELQRDFAPRLKLHTVPVVDKRVGRQLNELPRTPSRPLDMDCSSDTEEDFKIIRSTSAKKTTPRAGISDGFKNPGRGEFIGGGKEPFIIVPGTSFENEENESASGSKKRKLFRDDGDMDFIDDEVKSSRASPPRSRSGATYRGKSSVPKRLSGEEMEEKFRDMLQEKAVVCIFDSLGSKHRAIRNALREYLCLEYNDKKEGNIELEDVELEHIDVYSPTQSNFCDCGLYLLHAFERFFNDPKVLMKDVIPKRDRNDPIWLAEEAAQKREWWRRLVNRLAEQFSLNAANVLANRTVRLALKRDEGENNEGPAAAAITTTSSPSVEKDVTTDDDDDDDARSVSRLTNVQDEKQLIRMLKNTIA